MPKRVRIPAPLGLLCLFVACAAPPEDGPLEAGFSRVEMPWRVGAKPGQVGTHALDLRDQLFADGMAEISPILAASDFDPPYLLQDITGWALGRLQRRVDEVRPGAYAHLFEASKGLELPPETKALVLRRGKTKVAVVSADLYIMHEQLHRHVAELVERETGIGRDQLFLVATHNHSTPHALSTAPGVWTLADSFDPRHFVYVARKIAQAVVEADRNRRPARLRTAKRQLRDVQFNVIGPGHVTMPSPDDGALERIPVGYPPEHVDPDLVLLRFDRADVEEPIASLWVFGMHPESLKEGHGIISGEWPRHVEEKVERAIGLSSLWIPGPLGDSEPDKAAVNPDHRFMRAGFEAMDRMTDIIAAAVLEAHAEAGLQPGDDRPRVAQVARDIPGTADFPIPTSAYVAGIRLPFVRVLHEATTFRLHLVRLGDVLLIGAPAEITTDLALNIKSRLDREPGNVYQGYLWPGAPGWVHERVRRNFSVDEVDPAQGVPLPMIVSHANGYIGYIVSRWEYETRGHYRQEMTAYGPGTAEHVAVNALGLYRELEGGPRHAPPAPDWHPVDREGFERIGQFLRELEPRVVELSRAVPALDPESVGRVLLEPPEEAAEGDTIEFSWRGGSNDHDPPRVRVESVAGDEVVARGPSGEVWLLFEAPDRWRARWRKAAPAAEVRFVVEGAYRGPQGGASTPDPLWDPDGADRRYEVRSRAFRVSGPLP